MYTDQGLCEPLIDVETAAQIIGRHPKTTLRMARENKIPAYHIGRFWMFRASVINSWLNSQLQFTVANPSA